MKRNRQSAIAIIIGLLCVAHSREQDEFYQDQYANPVAKVGQQAAKQIEPAGEREV